MKEQQPEASWLTTYAWFFDLLSETIGAYNGTIVKYLGDGAMAVFAEDSAADALNWAIKIQEELADARAKNVVSCLCSVGIGYGGVVEFDTPQRLKDYIGSVVDKAFRLCGAANANAIFVDTDTVSAASMNRVQSRIGISTAPKRKAAEYQGAVESITLKGFSSPVNYHEIFWGSARYSVSAPYVTKLSSQEAPSQLAVATPPRAPESPAVAAGWTRGVVIRIGESFGFIKAGEEDFYFNSDFLFRRSLGVKLNDSVWFIPADPLPRSKARRATEVLPLGGTLDGRLEKVRPDRVYGFAHCENQHGEVKELFVFLGGGAEWQSGTSIEFTVDENRKGPSGRDPKLKA